ncbi:hypothetical protein Fmac_028866 [Flemingia macrophylla]|uniref:Uncharacterized protein n=1 Tax=Flemingia macrophylla TaxID=520843 RepID=A0ABD1L8Q8_9FABA
MFLFTTQYKSNVHLFNEVQQIPVNHYSRIVSADGGEDNSRRRRGGKRVIVGDVVVGDVVDSDNDDGGPSQGHRGGDQESHTLKNVATVVFNEFKMYEIIRPTTKVSPTLLLSRSRRKKVKGIDAMHKTLNGEPIVKNQNYIVCPHEEVLGIETTEAKCGRHLGGGHDDLVHPRLIEHHRCVVLQHVALRIFASALFTWPTIVAVEIDNAAYYLVIYHHYSPSPASPPSSFSVPPKVQALVRALRSLRHRFGHLQTQLMDGLEPSPLLFVTPSLILLQSRCLPPLPNPPTLCASQLPCLTAPRPDEPHLRLASRSRCAPPSLIAASPRVAAVPRCLVVAATQPRRQTLNPTHPATLSLPSPPSRRLTASSPPPRFAAKP